MYVHLNIHNGLGSFVPLHKLEWNTIDQLIPGGLVRTTSNANMTFGSKGGTSRGHPGKNTSFQQVFTKGDSSLLTTLHDVLVFLQFAIPEFVCHCGGIVAQ